MGISEQEEIPLNSKNGLQNKCQRSNVAGFPFVYFEKCANLHYYTRFIFGKVIIHSLRLFN